MEMDRPLVTNGMYVIIKALLHSYSKRWCWSKNKLLLLPGKRGLDHLNIQSWSHVGHHIGRCHHRGVPDPCLSNHSGNTNYASINEVHGLLTENAASAKSAFGGRKNGYLGLVLPPKQYSHISATPLVYPPNLVITATIPSWKPPSE